MDLEKLRRLADEGSCVGQSVLGACLLLGYETEVDYAEAFRLLSLAVEQGGRRATLLLGDMFAQGSGVAQDKSEAMRLYLLAAAAGEFSAVIEVGRAYARGTLAERDAGQARYWYGRALQDLEDRDVTDDARQSRMTGMPLRAEIVEARAYLEGSGT